MGLGLGLGQGWGLRLGLEVRVRVGGEGEGEVKREAHRVAQVKLESQESVRAWWVWQIGNMVL